MRFTATDIPGVTVIEAEPHADERGAFARLYCPGEFAAAGFDFAPRQQSLSRNPRRFTLRGLHYQDPPHAEAKLVRAVRGRIFDVAVDLRPESPAYRRWVGVELDAASMRALLIPAGCAHGFLTLEDNTDLIYQIDVDHVPGVGRGLRWDDPAIGIIWPAAPRLVSERDAAWPLLS